MASKPAKPRRLGFLTGLLSVFHRGDKVRKPDFKKHDFRSSTSRIGLSFTDKLREVFRRRWIKGR
jgi:hypothetical protein